MTAAATPATPSPTVSLRDEWGTPRSLFAHLDREFRFDLDAAATRANALCDRYLEDALAPAPWPGRSVWLNPPYSRDLLCRFLARASVEAGRGATVVCLVPSRTDTRWWHELVLPAAAEIRFLRGRQKFVPPPGIRLRPAGNRPVFASAVVIYRPSWPGRRTLVVRSMAAMQPKPSEQLSLPGEEGGC